MTHNPKDSCVAVREAWDKEAKQYWDGRTHGRGLSLLIVKTTMLSESMTSTSTRPLTVEFWRDQKKIRGRFIGVDPGNGVVVAKLGEDGIPLSE